MKRLGLALFLLALLLGSTYYYFIHQRQTQEHIEGIAYNHTTGQWERTKANTYGVNPDEVIIPENTDGLSNQAVLRGYFERYDESSQTLNMRVTVPFSQGTLFEDATLKLSPHQTIYCVPEHYTDPNTGRSTPMSKLMIPVQNGATLYLPNENELSFNDFVEQSTDLTFLLVQLTQAFTKEQNNYIQKLIVIGLCE